MQMMSKKENGITLVALAISVIVLLIIVGITITVGTSTLSEIRDEKNEINLSVIQEVLIQQYTLAKTKGELNKTAAKITQNTPLSVDAKRPKEFVGLRLADCSFLDRNGFFHKKDYEENMCYEDYYYYLTIDDLVDLNIATDTSLESMYIVNYSTGEVFDTVNVKYKLTDTSVSEKGTDYHKNEQIYNFTNE